MAYDNNKKLLEPFLYNSKIPREREIHMLGGDKSLQKKIELRGETQGAKVGIRKKTKRQIY
jgi:hypothetical protein